MSATHARILATADDPPMRRLLARIFELEGYQVVTASTGQQVLEQMEVQTPDRTRCR